MTGVKVLEKTDTCGPNGCPEFAEHSISQGISLRPLCYYSRDELEKDNDSGVVGLPPSFPIPRVIGVALVSSSLKNESMLSQLLTEGFDKAIFYFVIDGTESSNSSSSPIVFDLWLIHTDSRNSADSHVSN